MPGIPFIKDFKFDYGTAMEVTPLIRRVVAHNPSPFTFKGTGTYIIGHGKVAIVDPGPDQQDHIDAVLKAVRGETVTHIFVTHTHIDHVPATPAIAKATGAKGDPVVDVRNLTRTALTVWFSGECARKITVPPDSRTRAVLCPGDYVTAARIENPDILPIIGDQHLEHGAIYTLTFFIAKEPTVGKKKVVK